MLNGYALFFTAMATALAVALRRAANHDKTGIIARAFHWATQDRFAAPNGIPKYARLTGAVLFLAGAGIVATFPFVQDALGAWAANPWGLGVIAVIDLLFSGAIWYEWWHRHGYHPLWTNFSCALGGVMAVLTYASWHRMEHQGGKVLPKTFAGLVKGATRIGNGKAAQAASAMHGPATPLLVIAFIVLVIAVVWAGLGGHRWTGNRRRRGRGRAQAARARALSGGGAPTRNAIPVGGTPRPRKAVPAGGTPRTRT
jgi:hypothetical protein